MHVGHLHKIWCQKKGWLQIYKMGTFLISHMDEDNFVVSSNLSCEMELI